MPTIDASLSFRTKGLIAPGSRITVAVSRLPFTIASGDAGVVGSLLTKTISAGSTGAALSFLTKTLSVSAISGNLIDAALSLPQKFLEPVGIGGSVDVNVTAPQKATLADIFSGNAVTAAIALPLKTAEASYNPDVALQFLAKTADVSVISGSIAFVDVILPARQLNFATISEQLATVAVTKAALQASIEVVTGAVGGLAQSLSKKYMAAEVFSGTIAAAALTFPGFTLDARGFTPNSIDVSLILPKWVLSANVEAAVAAAYRAWILNVRKQALTEYSNFNFNSLAKFGDKVLAAGPDGLFLLGADNDDDGAQINAQVMTGVSDFGSSFNKRVPRLYAGYKSDGDMELQTITSQDGVRVYPLARNGITGIQQRRVITGRGPKSRYWQFSIANCDGADFEAESILVHPENIRRRII